MGQQCVISRAYSRCQNARGLEGRSRRYEKLLGQKAAIHGDRWHRVQPVGERKLIRHGVSSVAMIGIENKSPA